MAQFLPQEISMQTFSPNHYFDLATFAHAKLFDGCEYVWQALQAIDRYLKNYPWPNKHPVAFDGAYLIHPELIVIGEGTVIEPGAYIKGPCIIGKNCQIRHGAYIRGEVIVGDKCVIGHTTEIKHSIMLNNANAAHFAYLGDTIVGSHVNLGAGVKCANLRLDNQPIVIKTQEEKIATGMRKFGAIIGDYVEVGCNSVLNPGTILGKKVLAYPCLNFGGVIPEDHLVKPTSSITTQKKS